MGVTEQRSIEQAEPNDEIEALDREARAALDRLADKREEIERRHRETDLAAGRQRERGQERRREEARKAEERERRRRVEAAENLGQKRLALELKAEEQAGALLSTLQELLELDPRHERAVRAAHGKAPAQFVSMPFERVLSDWFRGRFGGTHGLFPVIGHDVRDGLGLVERDALTPPADASPKTDGGTPRGGGETP